MAKQRRAKARPTAPKASKKPASGAPPAPPAPRDARQPQTMRAAPPRRTSYPEAVARYERAMQALQRHDYGPAAESFRSILDDFPEEKELHERVRLYLNICARHVQPSAPEPRTNEERVYAATLALNAGRYEDARRHLEAVYAAEANHDHAAYMLAVVHALQEDEEQALAYLRRAIELNPDNRPLARQDPDLESIRDLDAVRALLDVPTAPRLERRRPIRARPR